MSAAFRQWLESLPSDYFATQHQFTKTGHRDVYDAIRPEDPRLSQKGKVVVVTGASSGIGRGALAISFAKAGAKAIYLVARRKDRLEGARDMVLAANPGCKVFIKTMSVTDEPAAVELFDEIKSAYGKADVLCNCAGQGSGGTILGSTVSAVWDDIDINVRGSLTMTKHFASLLTPEDKATIVNITSAAGAFAMPGTDSYGLAKLLQIQMQRYIMLANPNIFAASLQPGAILTEITKPGFERFSSDTMELAGGAALWLASPESDFMNGRYLDANWDIPELVERKDEIVKKGLLLMELKGDYN